MIVSGLLLNDCVTTIVGGNFSETDLLAAAGQRSFERGLGYLNAVEDLVVLGDQVSATVQGTESYIVILRLGGASRVRGLCDCPHGQEGFFCKHCVAVGLVYLGRASGSEDAEPQPDDRPDQRRPVNTSLHSWLTSLSKQQLVLLVLDQLVADPDWRHRLELRAAIAADDVDEVASRLYSLLDASDFGSCGYVDEGESQRYAQRVAAVVGLVSDLVDGGDAAMAQAIAESAIDMLSGVCRTAADPAGAIWAAVADLMDAHLAACMAGPPEPSELADYVAGRLLAYDMPMLADAQYRELLGEAGMSRVRELLDAKLAQDPDNWFAREARERVLHLIGDIDALVEHLSADLPDTGLGHLKIAAELDAVGRADEALTWARDGLCVSGYREPRIAEFVVLRLLGQRRVDEALSVRRDVFAARRDHAGFQQLRAVAERAGEWPEVRAWAFELLRADAEALRSRQRGLVHAQPPSALVDVLIGEGDVESAWQSASGVASEAQWLKLADLRAGQHPGDALAVYLRQLDQLKSETGDRAYERIARLLASVQACHRRLGTEQAFKTYLRSFRAEHKRKRKLLSTLDAHQL